MLKSLRRLVEEMEATSDFSTALSTLVKRVREALETESCAIFLLDFHREFYLLAASEGYADDYLQGLKIKADQGLIGLIGAHEKVLNLDDAPNHPQYFTVPESGEEIYQAFLGVPIMYDRRLLGVLMVEQQEARRYAEEEEAFLVTVASQLSSYFARQETTEIIAEQIQVGSEDDTVLLGIPSGSGVGIGQAVVVYPLANITAVPDKETSDIDAEIEDLKVALELTRDEIKELNERMSAKLPASERDLFIAYLRLLDSNSLEKEIIDDIKKGQWAQGALKNVIQLRTRQFESMDDAYLRECAADIRGLGQRVLAHLQRQEVEELTYPDNTILIGEELSAADLARVPQEKLMGIASGKGSSNSHVAILARALGIPAVNGVDNLPCAQLEDKELIIDGYYGHVYVTPTTALRQDFMILAEEERQLDESLQQLHDLPAETTDGYSVKLMVNTGLDADAGIALAAGSAGVGLFRSEIPFMARQTFPSEEEQRIIYKQMLAAFAPSPVLMRTLDVGGDKALPYFPINESNPFLGWRGIRISLDRPDIFLTQIRAMLLANVEYENLQILLPMISGLQELLEAKALIKQALDEVSEGKNINMKMPKIGVMIEVPSSVYQARLLAREADFLSVGSNDLTQYILAVDRNNAKVSGIYDAYHPAVLHALHQTVRSGHLEGKPVGICGELAGDPNVTLLLLAMGFDSLSTNASNLPRIKWVVRRFSMRKAREVLREVMKYSDPADIRTHLEATLERAGLGGLIRAGR
jgi:phosphotransferase system enzyme I (PtsP)